MIPSEGYCWSQLLVLTETVNRSSHLLLLSPFIVLGASNMTMMLDREFTVNVNSLAETAIDGNLRSKKLESDNLTTSSHNIQKT